MKFPKYDCKPRIEIVGRIVSERVLKVNRFFSITYVNIFGKAPTVLTESVEIYGIAICGKCISLTAESKGLLP